MQQALHHEPLLVRFASETSFKLHLCGRRRTLAQGNSDPQNPWPVELVRFGPISRLWTFYEIWKRQGQGRWQVWSPLPCAAGVADVVAVGVGVADRVGYHLCDCIPRPGELHANHSLINCFVYLSPNSPLCFLSYHNYAAMQMGT